MFYNFHTICSLIKIYEIYIENNKNITNITYLIY